MATFRGRPTCACVARWIPAFEVELRRRKLLTGNVYIYQLTGSAAASAGTHSGGGAIDMQRLTGAQRQVARNMGAASWGRGPAQGMIHHEHMVLIGCPHNGPARYQVAAYKAGFSGLGLNGRGSRDPFTRPAIRTWRQGIKWAGSKKPAKPKGLFGMAKKRVMINTRNRKVKAGLRRILPFNNKHGSSSLIWNATGDWEARVNVTLSGLATGTQYKGRFVKVKGNSNKVLTRLPVMDMTATPGKTHAQFTGSSDLGKGERLRFELWCPSSPFVVERSEARIRWK